MNASRGFSLVEVVMALGIFSFALVVMLSLLPAGLKMDQRSEDESFAVNALSAIIGDRTASSVTNKSTIYQLPALTQTNAVTTLYLSENYTLTNQTSALYQVQATYLTPASGSLSPYLIHFRVTWPAASKATPRGSLETISAISQVNPLP